MSGPDAGRGNRRILGGILIATIAGGFCGWHYGPRMESVAFLGDFFLLALKTLVVPLVVTSLVMGMVGLGDIRRAGRMGRITVIFYLSSMAVAVAVGMAFVNWIRPGDGFSAEPDPAALERARSGMPSEEREAFDRSLDRIRLEREAQKARVESRRAEGKEGLAATLREMLLSLVPGNIVRAAAEMQILPLVVFSLLLGGALTTLGEKGKPVIAFFEGMNEAVLKIVSLVMYLAPVGIFGLVAAKLGERGGGEVFWLTLRNLGAYAATVLVGLAVHGGIILVLALRFLGGRSPWTFLKAFATPLFTAFSTASSAATMPLTIQAAKTRAGISPRTADFVIPVGATVNMDGTALYEAVAVTFIAQSYGIELSVAQQAILFLTANLAAIGAAAIPEAGLVTMLMVLAAVGLPAEGVGLILAIDWFLDRCRTTVNVWDDCVGAAVVDRLANR